MATDAEQKLEVLSEDALGLMLQEAYELFRESDAFPDGDPQKDALQKRAGEIFDEVDKAVVQNPQLLKAAWEKMEEEGYGGDAHNLVLLTARDGRGMAEQALLEHVKSVATEMVAAAPAGWDLTALLREIDLIFLNERQNQKMKLADRVPSPEIFGTMDDIKAGIRALLEEDGVMEPDRFESGILTIYEQKILQHWYKACEEGREKEFVEKFPTGTPKYLWESYYLSYVSRLFKKDGEGTALHDKSIISSKDAFDWFSPEVLAAMAAGKEGENLHGKTRRDKLGSIDNWNAQEKAEIVRRLVESDAVKDGLALLEVMDLPLPVAEEFRSEFYKAYLRRDPGKITENAEFFEGLVRESGLPKEALAFLDSRKQADLETSESIKAPGQEEVESMKAEEVLKIVMENHAALLKKMKKLGTQNIPHYGLSGGDKPEVFLAREAANERVYLQFVASVEAQDDANLALVDMYDNVGGDKGYFANKGYSLFITDLGQSGTARLRDYWGEKGEFKNWNIDLLFQTKPLDLARGTGFTLAPELVQFLRFFQATKEEKIRPHAEKTDRSFAAGSSKSELSKRIIGTIKADDTPLHLLDKQFQLPPDETKRQVFTEMVYVQFVADKILDAFIARLAA